MIYYLKTLGTMEEASLHRVLREELRDAAAFCDNKQWEQEIERIFSNAWWRHLRPRDLPRLSHVLDNVADDVREKFSRAAYALWCALALHAEVSHEVVELRSEENRLRLLGCKIRESIRFRRPLAIGCDCELAAAMPNARKELSLTKRLAVFHRDGYRCKACGASSDDGHELECDHIVPVSRGGSSHMTNLQTLCKSCNSSKGDKMPAEWQGRAA